MIRVMRQLSERPDDYPTLSARSVADQGVVTVGFDRDALAHGSIDVWHIDWPEHRARFTRTLRAARGRLGLEADILVARSRGIPIVWTVHNLLPHDPLHSRLRQGAIQSVARQTKGTIHLGIEARKQALARYPSIAGGVNVTIRHGHYREVYRQRAGRWATRQKLDIPPDSFVFGLVGALRPYKGVEELLRVFARTKDADYRLLLAGQVSSPSLKSHLREASLADPRIRFLPGTIDYSDMADLVSAIDVGVLPFRRILNSGSAVLFLSFNRPILVPDLPQFRELADTAGQRWVRRYEGPLSVSQLERLQHGQAVGEPDLRSMEWSKVGRELADFYRKIARAHS
jgi:glycosyltransferase involved in cell wall biosynthesis